MNASIADSAKDIIKQVFGDLWAETIGNVAYFATFQFLDPIVKYVVYALVITIAICALLWFFGVFSKWLRPIGGLLIVLMWGMIYVFHRGEKEAREHDAAKKPKPKPPEQQADRGGGWFGS